METLFGFLLLFLIVTSVLFFIVLPIMRKPVDPFLKEETPDDEKKKRIADHRDSVNSDDRSDDESTWKL